MWMSRYHNEIFAKAWEYLEFLYTSHLTCFILLNWIAHNFFEHGSLHRFESLKFIFSLNMKVIMIVINVNNKELIWNIGKGHENIITMFLIFDFLTFLWFFAFSTKIFLVLNVKIQKLIIFLEIKQKYLEVMRSIKFTISLTFVWSLWCFNQA